MNTANDHGRPIRNNNDAPHDSRQDRESTEESDELDISIEGSFYATKLDGRHCHISGLGFDWRFHVYYHLVYTDTLKCIDDKSQRHDFIFNSLHELEGATTDNKAADRAINSSQVDLLSQGSVYALAIASADRCWAAAQEVFKFVSGSLDAALTDDNVGHFMFLLCAKY
ncbi:hypothetical protein FOZ63_012259, partial [Perkinsus olseni]